MSFSSRGVEHLAQTVASGVTDKNGPKVSTTVSISLPSAPQPSLLTSWNQVGYELNRNCVEQLSNLTVCRRICYAICLFPLIITNVPAQTSRTLGRHAFRCAGSVGRLL